MNINWIELLQMSLCRKALARIDLSLAERRVVAWVRRGSLWQNSYYHGPRTECGPDISGTVSVMAGWPNDCYYLQDALEGHKVTKVGALEPVLQDVNFEIKLMKYLLFTISLLL